MMKVKSGALLYQLRIEKVFSTQKVMSFAIPMKDTTGSVKHIFV